MAPHVADTLRREAPFPALIMTTPLSRHFGSLAVLFALPLFGQAQTTVFRDTFLTSTINSAAPAAPTASATDYAIASSKNATGSSLTAGRLNVYTPATSSGFTEAQARFAASPIALASAGQFIKLTAVFTANNINLSGNATFNFGLYNSGGVNPVAGGGLANTGLGTASSTYASGYAAGWLGYVGRVGTGAGASSLLVTRPIQTDTSNESQDLLFNDAGTGAYDTPLGTTVGTTTSAGAVLVTGNDYTYSLTLTRTSAGLLALDQSLYSGMGTGGTLLFSQTGTTTLASTITTQFDALAVGYRGISSSAAMNLSLSSLTVAIPEPATGALFLAGLAALFTLRRARRA